ncbi:MAG: ABC transporter substrate-binding protein [Pseudomonadales bacterium RIFCSPLOWO2_12_60_38]|uniref:DUF2076 domain-containing protein n=1 Tax=Pseudomonas TaxID=286 RepID=UPI0003DDD20E|nr:MULTISPECIES: DUF2076 domain-containing protein [Pseudomonas]ETK38389.1 ABC transporter substrate-binding protein [Pseudomonas fluorescens FH5]MBD8256617.1 DUF2076 domain-containing protein [Pseudomonas fluorescens]OHC32876.1 MAG: ABC transporter substrate-binding protein [Pseudomonadales bacterium RIFCSPLOWO2_12_60_38]OHC41848.1 MAG: ABC transporter substrate-binding protein [Pseudomonadales bacterium RIFCSPLOWO2_12_FULL_59_450]PMZ73329.1 DUF2076 domain-containing protein [Pseudomonas sp. 
MNSEEQTLIDGLFSRLQQAETDSAPRDAQAEARIKEHMARQPAVGYYMTQSILVQEHALQSLDAQNKQQAQQIQQLQDELQRAKATQPAPASGGGFLSSIFGGGSREPQPAPSNTGGGWREPARPAFGQPAPQQNYQPPQAPAAAPAGSGFLGGAMKTAAGVAGGVLLAEGISSLFHHNQQPQVVEEIIEQPAPASDQGNWGNDDQKFAGNDSWGSNSDNFADSDYSDDSSSFGDDDSFV